MISTNLEEVMQVIIKEFREKVAAVGQTIATELTEEARTAIESFYGHYSPTSYDRQKALNSSYKRYYKNAHGNIVHGGVELMPSNGAYFGYHGTVSIDPAWPSALAIFNGMHGNVEAFPNFNGTVPPRMSPTPYRLIEMKQLSIVDNIQSYFG